MEKTIYPASVSGAVKAPASKSFAQRAVAAALLADGISVLRNMDLCNDTEAAVGVARCLGAEVAAECDTYTIKGGLDPLGSVLDIGESGLATRLFTPIAALCGTPMTITGHGSILSRLVEMMERPLRGLGAKVETSSGFLPVTVCGPLKGGEVEVDGSMSSQFISGLLFALPVAEKDSVLRVNKLNSIPYIDMTLAVIRDFGVEIVNNAHSEFRIKGGQKYMPTDYNVEGDWSGASCLLVAGAVAGEVTVRNLNKDSLQADIAILDALRMAGANVAADGNDCTVKRGRLSAFEFDATHCPDLFPALAVLAANCEGVSVIKGTNRLANKESDRTKTVAEVLGRLGIGADISRDDLMIITGGPLSGGEITSHNDHRIAMAGAVAALTASGPVTIAGADAVNKSYPQFWDDLSRIIKC